MIHYQRMCLTDTAVISARKVTARNDCDEDDKDEDDDISLTYRSTTSARHYERSRELDIPSCGRMDRDD